MSSILSTVAVMRPAAPAPDRREDEALSLSRREDAKKAAEDKQKGEETLLRSAGKLSQANSTIGATSTESVKTKERTAPQRISSAPVVDQYVQGQEPEPAGLYRTVPDEKGMRSIVFDDPEKKTDGGNAAEKAPHKASPDEKAEGKDTPDNKEETVTANTDKVEAEIRKLKEKLEALKQQLARAKDNPDEQKKLESQIAQVENELRIKDTDTYRRQHTQFS